MSSTSPAKNRKSLKQKKMTDYYKNKRKTFKQKKITDFYSPRTAPTFNEIMEKRHVLGRYYIDFVESLVIETISLRHHFQTDRTHHEYIALFYTDDIDSDDLYYVIDEENMLDRNKPITKKYLKELKRNHMKQFGKDSKMIDDEEFEDLENLTQAFFKGLRRGSGRILARHIKELPYDMTNIISEYVDSGYVDHTMR